jgi:phosphatidylethanolamine-binding protein (PEBP) family uncharacterized protein
LSLLGTLLRNRRPNEGSHAWNQPNLSGPDTLTITSTDFTDCGTLPAAHSGTRVGGQNLSPQLTWSEPPAGTAGLVLLVEDLDAPLGSSPAVHCLIAIDEAALKAPHTLASGALDGKNPAPGVTPLRSVIGRGYKGPEPLKGHGPHRYVFQIYALGESILSRRNHDTVLKTKPRSVLASINGPVLARGRITGISERK